jgi:hypothetical protein
MQFLLPVNTKDSKFSLTGNMEAQSFNTAKFEHGFWKIIIYWNSNETEYMFDDSFFK